MSSLLGLRSSNGAVTRFQKPCSPSAKPAAKIRFAAALGSTCAGIICEPGVALDSFGTDWTKGGSAKDRQFRVLVPTKDSELPSGSREVPLVVIHL